MDVHGFHIVSEPTDQNESGFSTTVTDATGAVRGPFKTIKEAIDCAHAWNSHTELGTVNLVEEAAPIPLVENNEQAPTTETK